MPDSFLHDHGTKLMQLKPSSIVTAAERDISRKFQNAVAAKLEEPTEPYAFCSKHVKKSSTAIELVRNALSDLTVGQKSGKLMTRVIYGEEALLRAALELLNEAKV